MTDTHDYTGARRDPPSDGLWRRCAWSDCDICSYTRVCSRWLRFTHTDDTNPSLPRCLT